MSIVTSIDDTKNEYVEHPLPRLFRKRPAEKMSAPDVVVEYDRMNNILFINEEEFALLDKTSQHTLLKFTKTVTIN